MTVTGISSRYAHALVDALADPKANLDAYAALRDLGEFVDAIRGSRDLDMVLLSPSVPPKRKRFVVRKLAERMKIGRLVINFLLVLIDHRRIALLKEIAPLASLFLDERLGFLRADVAAAAPLSDDERRRIAEMLQQITGKTIRVEMEIAPDLIGGVIARVGSKVYDGSVRGQLRTLGARLAAE
jgi:F-type H+-transporting ATPase subunit delta